MTGPARSEFDHPHLLGIEGLSAADIQLLLDLGDHYVDLNRSDVPAEPLLANRIQIDLFFENSTRTRMSFELAGKQLAR